jgi:uncharacterized protein (TIGR02678 family)
MTTARVAVQLDPAELDEFQRAARLLLAHPLVTPSWPRAGALALVRRWEQVLRAEMGRILHYHLDVAPTCARLVRRSASLSPHRPGLTATGRPFTRWTYTYLCLVLAAIEGLGQQTTISQLAEEVARLRAGDDALPVDLTRYDQRRALVDAAAWLESRGVLTLRDGATESFLDQGDALYDIDGDAASRLLVASPSVLREVAEAGDFLAERYPPGDQWEQRRTSHRLARRLVSCPVVYYDDLPADELAFARQRRTRLADELERLTGCTIEARAEGLALVDATVEPLAREPFPGRGAVAHAALLLGEQLCARSPVTDGSTRQLDATSADEAWAAVVASHGDRFTAEYRDDPDRLRRDALGLLERLDLADVLPGGAVAVRAALARYRPAVHRPDDPQLSLLADA